MPVKIIALDLDGTLLTHDKRLTERTRETLRKAAEQGNWIVPATGRALKAIPADPLSLLCSQEGAGVEKFGIRDGHNYSFASEKRRALTRVSPLSRSRRKRTGSVQLLSISPHRRIRPPSVFSGF